VQTDLSIIIVSWNVWDLLRACLTSLEQVSRAGSNIKNNRGDNLRVFGPATLGAQAPTLEVIVVDNASADATADLLPARFPWVRLIRSATNLGFTAGNNVGYATSRGRTVFFLNPDTEVVNHFGQGDDTADANSLWTLYRALLDNPSVGLVGPQLRYADNTLQSSRRRFPTPLTGFMDEKAIGRYWHNNPWLRDLHMADWPATFRQEIDWVMGAAMLARREALEGIRQPHAAGPFDESFFMYSEEVDLCKRLGEAGWKILYVSDAVVIHYEGKSASQIVAATQIHFHRSMVRYYEKHFGPRWAAALRYFVRWNTFGQLWIERAKWLLGHKRPLRAQRIGVYREVLAANLRSDTSKSGASKSDTSKSPVSIPQ
jgi:N-acetylglucosaminyl-diphospho-decaprenol L-rhamnosyltransferase